MIAREGGASVAGLLAFDALMWDNALATYEGRAVHVPGHRRAFVGEDPRRFGSPERPCPRLSLVPGDGCDAVLFRIPRGDRRYLVHNLRQREGRRARRVPVRDGDGPRRRALAFLAGGDERAWPDRAAVVEALREARGLVGTGAEYIRTIVHAMELWEIEDPVVGEIWERVRGWTAGRWEPGAA